MQADAEKYARFIPRAIRLRIRKEGASPSQACAEYFPGAVLFADIAGYTALTEHYSERGAEGIERLKALLDDFFTRVENIVFEHGGDIIGFAGDSLLAVWPAQSDAELYRAVLVAAQCGCAMREAFAGADADTALRTRVVLAAGEIGIASVGGGNGEWRHIAVGEPLLNIGYGMSLTEPGSLVLSATAWKLIRPYSVGVELSYGNVRLLEIHLPFAKLNTCGPYDESGEVIAARCYVPKPLMKHLDSTPLDWLTEFRRVSVSFVLISSINYAARKSLDELQAAVSIVQAVVFRFGGVVMRVMVDDKGTTVLCAWGVPGATFEDDPARAVGAGMELHARLRSRGMACGVGITTGTDSFPEFGLPKVLPTRVYALHTANRGAGTQYLTGVVFRDRNGNLRYDPGEGVEGAEVHSTANAATTLSLASGGWSLPAVPGSTVVSCTFEDWVARSPITVGSSNVEVDFHVGLPGGEVSFGFRNGLPASAGVYANAIYTTGTGSFDVLFNANGDFDHVAWKLPDGNEVLGTTLDTSVPGPGLHPYLMTATSMNTWSTDVVVAVSDRPDGAGEGTTLPVSRVLTAPKGLLKRNFKTAGLDQAKLAATLELPGGFVPEGRTVQVCIGGAKGTFVLDAKGKAKDLATGSTLVLKAKYPVGAGVPAGTLAKATATLKGDLARALEATGLEHRTAAGVLRTVPAALWIDGVGYPAYLQSTVTATFGKSGKSALVALPPE